MTSPSALSDIRMRDPFILEPKPGEFVLYGTTDVNVWGGPGVGFDCYTSTDLENWLGPFPAFRPPAGYWADTQFWAPEVHAYGGSFHMFATMSSSRSRVRGVVVLASDDPTGPFVPWSDGPVTPADIPCLDATFTVDDADRPWIVYSRGAEGALGGEPGLADGEMYARLLSADLRRPEGSPVLLFRASAAPWSKPLQFPPGVDSPPHLNLAKDPLFTDGPFLLRSLSGDLLMLWSSFGDEGYAIGVARSSSGDLLGPWIHDVEPLWARNGGHGMVLLTFAGSSFLVFHAPNDTPHERVVLAEIELTEHGLTLTPGGTT